MAEYRSLAAIDAGTYYHHHALHAPRYRGYFDDIIYVRDLPDRDLSGVDVLIVTCRTDPALMMARRDQISDFLARGGMVCAMGSTGPHLWLPQVRWTDSPTNYWWWREPGGDLGLTLAAPEHPLFRHITMADATWHHHGAFSPPPGAVSLIDARGLGSVLYEDAVSTPGRMLVTALDPFYHHGSHFMPATTRFLDGFLPWLRGAP